MKHSEMLNLNLPEDSDLINVSQISDNFERLDSVVDIIPVKQETTTTDIDTTVYPPYWSMTNNTDSNITYVDHKFFDEEFVIEPGQTIRTDIDTSTEISISSETTLDYVYYIPAKDAFSGGGGGGTSDYNKLSNQPKVNGVTLSGNKSAADLGLAAASDLSDKVNTSEKGASNGIATLDTNGKVPQSQLPTPVAQREYKLTETTSESYAKSYKLQVKNGETWSDVSESASINIPKDMVVESGSVKECTTDNVPVSGYKKGDKYIDLVIANKTDAHIYINVKDLIDNKAEGIQYSNTTSKLTATNVQSAIDEIAETLKDKVDETELLSTISASSTTQIRDSKIVEFDGTGKNLEKLVLEGKTVQDGTPSPDNPIEVKGVGDYDEETGKYKIPIPSGGTTKNVYLDTPVFNGEKADVVSGVAEKKWGMMVLDGTQVGANMASGRTHAVYGIIISNMKAGSRSNGYCDRFVPANSWDQEGTVAFGTNNKNLYITFPDSLGISTIEQAKAWFAANPTTIVYPLDTDTKETFDGAEIPTSVGKNTLSVDTEVTPASIEAVTFGDYYSKSQIDKMFADVQADLAAMAELL